MELIVRAQSALGMADGSFQVFLDDVEVTTFFEVSSTNNAPSSIAWYAPGNDTRLFSGVQQFLYWGGSGDTKTVDDYIELSEFYITGVQASN